MFLRSHKSLESVDPQFTMRRKMEQLREELELMEQLREVRWRPLAAVSGQGAVRHWPFAGFSSRASRAGWRWCFPKTSARRWWTASCCVTWPITFARAPSPASMFPRLLWYNSHWSLMGLCRESPTLNEGTTIIAGFIAVEQVDILSLT